MTRDAIAEWLRALISRERAYRALAQTRPIELPSQRVVDRPLPSSFDVRRTRPLEPLGALAGDRGDLSRAIRVLQRHNRLLRATYGIGWADATSFVLGEASRRGTSAATLARAVSVRLRAEAS